MHKSTNILLKPYIRKFILQIHPDFFQQNKLVKQKNEASLQKLYTILQSDKKATSKEDVTYMLEFYSKDQKTKTSMLAPKATQHFSLYDSDWIKANSFLNLCQQLNVPVLQSDLTVVQDMIKKEFENEASKTSRKPFKSLTKEFAERLYQQSNDMRTKEWNSNDVINNKLVMFDPAVDNSSKLKVAQQLSEWIPKLQPSKWWGKVPLLVLSSETKALPEDSIKGILVVRSDMSFEDIKSYFHEKLDGTLKEMK